MPSFEQVLSFAERFGFPATITAAVLYALWRVARWSGENVFVPLVSSTVELHETLKKNDTDKTLAIANLSRLHEDHLDRTSAIGKQVEDIHRVVCKHE